jgi:MFS family permease
VTDTQNPGSWRELASHGGTAAVLAGGVLAGAVSIYLAASLLPSAVEEIGGEQLYAWNATAFLLAQVVATMFVGRLLGRHGAARSYLIAFGVFTAGSLLCAVSPTMPAMLAGRGVQGVGAGLLTGFGFAVLHSALPPRLWTRGTALVSAMFGVGNFVGPALGGLFAQLGSWRMAFVALALATAVLAAIVPRALRGRGGRGSANPVPVGSLLLVVAAVAAVGVAGVVTDAAAMVALVLLAVVLAAAFLGVDARTGAGLLPRSTYRRGAPLRWIYLTVVLLASGVAVETFLPLFGQQLGGLPPLAAGFFGAALSLGWSASQIVSSSARTRRSVRRLQVTGPVLLTTGFAVLALLQHEDAAPAVTLAWLPVLLAGGAGIGLAMPHLSVAAMSGIDDPGEGGKAAAAVATVLTMSTAFGGAVAGLLVNLGGPDTVTSARSLLAGFAVLAGLAVLTALRATRPASTPVR